VQLKQDGYLIVKASKHKYYSHISRTFKLKFE